MTANLIDLSAALADILHRGEDAEAIQNQARQVGGCEQPIRLRGALDTLDRVTGELERTWSSATLPDGVVHTRCNNRRASRCQPCSRLYQQDAWQLVVSGLTGGKGIPTSVADHPTLFLTLTAPSFGPVHTRTLDQAGQVLPCRARRAEAAHLCPHGRALTCAARHAEDDPILGRPLCLDCWDYAGAVLWNAHAGELWRRTIIQLYRELAALVGLTERALKRQVSVQYVKVAEYQRRGLVHFHALIRLDAARPPATQRLGVPWRLPHRVTPPAERFTVELLAEAIRRAVARVTVPYPEHLLDGTLHDQTHKAQASTRPAHRRLPDVTLTPQTPHARWGAQLDLREVSPEQRSKVAGYLAKYATKHTETAGGLDRPVKAEDLGLLPVCDHAHRLIVTAHLLAVHAPQLRTDRWAHQLGFGGHFLTKSRHYSTTFTTLRTARARWQARHQLAATIAMDPWERLWTTARRELVGSWQLAGIGWRLAGDALLAHTTREQARAAQEAARQARHERAEVLALAG